MSVQERFEAGQISEDQVQQMLLLAERLREAHGGELDDEAILAVSEMTGAPVDYVRGALVRRPEQQKQTVTKKLRGTYLSLGPEERAWVSAGAIGAGAGFAYALNHVLPKSNGLFGILMILLLVIGFATIGLRKDSRLATISGAILGCVGVISSSVFGLVFGLGSTGEPWFIVPITIASAFLGFAIHKTVANNRKSFGLKDRATERQDLLRQLHELQAQLESGKQSLTFLSVDVVGSTKMKATADPLKIEFTFNEYHRFIERIAAKFGGRVHSTAGDGVTCAFDQPNDAFKAAMYTQADVLEFNAYGNKLGTPIVLRCGIHTGEVVAPDINDITSVNFAHVIDIAAHLQKVCPEGGIVVSEEAALYIPNAAARIGADRVEADGVKALVWKPRVRQAQQTDSATPPFIPEQA